jgi:hypothetical protein
VVHPITGFGGADSTARHREVRQLPTVWANLVPCVEPLSDFQDFGNTQTVVMSNHNCRIHADLSDLVVCTFCRKVEIGASPFSAGIQLRAAFGWERQIPYGTQFSTAFGNEMQIPYGTQFSTAFGKEMQIPYGTQFSTAFGEERPIPHGIQLSTSILSLVPE